MVCGCTVRKGDVAEIQIVALAVEEARLHYSDYELYEVPGDGALGDQTMDLKAV